MAVTDDGKTGWSKAIWGKAMGLRQRVMLWQARRMPKAAGFAQSPEPLSIGRFDRARQLMSGQYLFAGQLVEAPDYGLFQIEAPSEDFAREAHGFVWLEDLAAVGDVKTREVAQGWWRDWHGAFGQGQSRVAFEPAVIGRRLLRLLHHAVFLQPGFSFEERQAFFVSLSLQAHYLAKVWRQAGSGLARMEALSGLVAAGLILRGLEQLVAPALTALSDEVLREVDAGGGIGSRNPEELLEICTLLVWLEETLASGDRALPPEIRAGINRIAPVLRLLRHADGGLARFHDGGAGSEGRLDQALFHAGVKPGPVSGHAHGPLMGYVRLFAGRSSLIMDVASPPAGVAGARGHASTLAMELTSGRRPLIVNCGSGAPFGPSWRQAGRATPSHSTLCLEGVSSSRFGKKGGSVLEEHAAVLSQRQMETETGAAAHAAHDGWAGTHGLTHARDLAMTVDGRHIAGSDTLVALNPRGRARFEKLVALKGGAHFFIRFHLHPDVDATLDMGGNAVSMALKSGEIWVFRHDGQCKLTLEPSVYLEKGRFEPRACKQMVLSGHAGTIETRIGWTLAKAQDTPLAIRDLDREDLSVSL